MNGDSVEKVWDLGDKDVDKWFAILTSCSAPTYFDVIVDDKGNSYCDGGMWSNCCTDVLLAGQFKQGHKDIKILDFGTGLDTPNTEKGNKTLLGWAEYIISDWAARASKSPIYEAKAILGEQYVFSACPKYKKKLKMDDVSDKNIELVVKIWQDYYESVKKYVLDFIKNR
jgi:predicted acylesterase/phospholipase RssA